MCVLMALAIDSVVPGFHIYKDVWSAGMDSDLLCSPESAIAKTGIVLCTHACSGTLRSLHDAVNSISCCGN